MIPTARPAAPATLPAGTGHAPCHHGEILQGVFLDGAGRRCAGLVTLPMAGPGSRARFRRWPGTSPQALTVVPADRTKAARAAALAVAECAERTGRPPCGGELRLTGDIPVGLGMGSSTSDVIATVRAVADSYGLRLPPDTVARLAVRAEQACDPLMLDRRPVLFAQREGRVLEVLGPALPPLVVVGCALGGGAPVDTLTLPAPTPAEADAGEVRAFERLRALLRRAVATGDVRLLGEVATASAWRGQRALCHPEFDALTGIARRVGAAGVQIAHSGAVAGLLFDPAAPGLRRRVRGCLHALDAHGIPATRTFTTTEEIPHGPAHRGVDRPAGPGPARRRARLPAL
ncbi:GHMP kinase [Streptomyces sp. NBC_00091]|uniref:GHMP family kinase ATP-binding protein n=1 Tax=Streptomyces sp. NBC_00091 TaxID=2975648 RepID=UPI002258738C|nr:GHMP kinase [Streptomyces sp. NBC_00091]MCX5379733.1 GHMP kinase [Streptomyces sp. NBC_00091]